MSLFRLYAPEECTGRDGYPPEWHETIKHLVRAEAGNRCVRCQHPYEKGDGQWSACDRRCAHGGPFRLRFEAGNPGLTCEDPALSISEAMALDTVAGVEAQWRILTVHHLDGVKGNCRWWNLVALCQRCHLQIQGKVQMERRWLGEHTDWFKPYVAGYYAFTFRGLDLERPAVEDQLDELLALDFEVAL